MAMQRLCTKLRSLSVHSTQTLPSFSSSFLCSSPLLHQPLPFASNNNKWSLRSLFNAHSPTQPSLAIATLRHSTFPISMLQVRHVSSRERKKRRKPMTPVTSKLKKTKIKAYSSYKSRFRTMNDGKIRRWREGKRHNAHLKRIVKIKVGRDGRKERRITCKMGCDVTQVKDKGGLGVQNLVKRNEDLLEKWLWRF